MTVAPLGCITIDNLEDIARAYGDEAGERVRAQVIERLEAEFGGLRRLLHREAWGASLDTGALTAAGVSPLQFERALHHIGLAPIDLRSGQVVAALSLRPVHLPVEPRLTTAVGLSLPEFRVAMNAAAMAYGALAAGRLDFVEQPIRSASCGKILYSECLARITAESGHMIVPSVYISALERLGLTKAFDKHVVELTVEKLRHRPNVVLGCNVSGCSAALDAWWHKNFPLLFDDRELAGRFVLEITETARPYDLSKAVGFVEIVRRTGCRVALDDFGAGYSSIGFARDARFDIIKIDGSYVRNHVAGEFTPGLLNHLVDLAHQMAPGIVIEGIENEIARAAAVNTGAEWLQGYYIDLPAAPVSTWSMSPIAEARG